MKKFTCHIVFFFFAYTCAVNVYAQNDYVDMARRFVEGELSSTERLIRVCWVLLFIFFSVLIIIVTSLFIGRTINNRVKRRNNTLRENFENILTEIVFGGDEEEIKEEQIHAIRKQLNGAHKKRVFREQLLILHKNLYGSSAEMLKRLYRLLGLQKQAMAEVRSDDWGIKARAVRELTQMDVKEAAPAIKKLNRHRNHILRLEAQAASILLDESDPFSFLDHNNNTITEWHELNLMRAIEKMDEKLLPDFTKWFSSGNASVVAFCVKMVRTHNRFDAIPALEKLLQHKDQKVVEETLKTLGAFGAEETESSLMDLYAQTSITQIKREVLHTLGQTASHKAVGFLLNELFNEDVDLAFVAGKGLKDSGHAGVLILGRHMDNEKTSLGAICKHLLDNRI